MSKKFLSAPTITVEETQPRDELEKFLTVPEVASLLCVKPRTIYQWVNSGEIPHYRLKKFLRFKKKDLEAWVDGYRKEEGAEGKKAREILTSFDRPTQNLDRIFEKSIAEVKGNRYTSSLEKPGKDKGLGKEESYGLV